MGKREGPGIMPGPGRRFISMNAGLGQHGPQALYRRPGFGGIAEGGEAEEALAIGPKPRSGGTHHPGPIQQEIEEGPGIGGAGAFEPDIRGVALLSSKYAE